MRWWHYILLLLTIAGQAGCAIVQVSVRNPVIGLEKVAIAPFFNLSSERSVDGYDFAEAYYTELQKVPGFEVVPVGIADRAIRENQLTMDGPEDALKLARLLDVDAVVIGAITDYDPYVPRVGLKVSWYSERDWEFQPVTRVSSAGVVKKTRVPQALQLGQGRVHLPPAPTNNKQSRQKVAGSGTSNAAFTIRGQSPLFEHIPEGNWQVDHSPITDPEADDFMPPRPVSRTAHSNHVPTTAARQTVTQEFVYEVIPGPLFGEPRVLQSGAAAPTAIIIEEPEFVSFPTGDVTYIEKGILVGDDSNPVIIEQVLEGQVIEGPIEFIPHAAFLPDEVAYAPQSSAGTAPLPLPLPPAPVTSAAQPESPASSGSAKLNATPRTPTSKATPPALRDQPQRLPQATREAAPIQRPQRGAVADRHATSSENLSDQDASVLKSSPAGSASVGSASAERQEFDPRQPLMSYVRMFDGTDAALVARLTDYLELSGETRTGDVSAFMRRTDFFQKFTAHVMIAEMLSLHGGEAQHRWVLKSRQYR